jgi:hypothetical protein
MLATRLLQSAKKCNKVQVPLLDYNITWLPLQLLSWKSNESTIQIAPPLKKVLESRYNYFGEKVFKSHYNYFCKKKHKEGLKNPIYLSLTANYPFLLFLVTTLSKILYIKVNYIFKA